MPSYGSHGALFEAGWMLCEIYNRFVLNLTGGRRAVIVEVAPTQLKKWATGNGGPDKGKLRMKAAIKERWGKEFERDPKGNLTDAYALYKYGIALLNGEIEHKPTPRRGKKKNAKRKTDSKGTPQDKPDKSVRGGARGRKTPGRSKPLSAAG